MIWFIKTMCLNSRVLLRVRITDHRNLTCRPDPIEDQTQCQFNTPHVLSHSLWWGTFCSCEPVATDLVIAMACRRHLRYSSSLTVEEFLSAGRSTPLMLAIVSKCLAPARGMLPPLHSGHSWGVNSHFTHPVWHCLPLEGVKWSGSRYALEVKILVVSDRVKMMLREKMRRSTVEARHILTKPKFQDFGLHFFFLILYRNKY